MQKKYELQLLTYNKFIWRKKTTFFVTLVMTLLVAIYATSKGSLEIPMAEIARAILKKAEPHFQIAVMQIRLPRVTAAIVVGAALAAAGAVMQCVLHNPLASASTLGVSQGAAFGAALGIIVFGGGVIKDNASATAIAVNNPYIVTICAFLFGSVSTVVVMVLSRLKKNLGPGGLILAGVALSSLFGGGSALLQYFADETKISAVVFWTFGNLGGAGWGELLAITAVFLVSLIYFLLNRWNYNALESGGDTAKSLGVDTRKLTITSMGICSLLAAVSVSFVGIISFVGLVAPHIMRRFVGNDYRYLVPCSAVAGSFLLVSADTFARLIKAPVILPIGAITSFLGAPLFLYLLFRGFDKNG